MRQHVWSSSRRQLTPLCITLHWLTVAACICYRVSTAPTSLDSLMQIYESCCSIQSANERPLVLLSWGRKSKSKLFSPVCGGTSDREAESLTNLLHSPKMLFLCHYHSLKPSLGLSQKALKRYFMHLKALRSGRMWSFKALLLKRHCLIVYCGLDCPSFAPHFEQRRE